MHGSSFYVFGGYHSQTRKYFQDINFYDPKRSLCVSIKPKGSPLCTRRNYPVCHIVGDRVFIFVVGSLIYSEAGGIDQKYHFDLHVLDLSRIFYLLLF